MVTFYWMMSGVVMGLALVWSKTMLAKAGMLLQEKERLEANRLMRHAVPVLFAVTLLFLAGMTFAGFYFPQYSRWLAFAIPGIFLVLYAMLNQRLYSRFLNLGFPDDFGRQFLLSRIILVIALLMLGHFLMSYAEIFNKG